ncbi:hypothetical protein CPB83DRAFT_609346 [Crepidotus variabilis]|uniref:Uncharacterized protein n=1 Tax=Crepidotus variabilis TaxID=179855 RepID=A0A9P6E8J4_9AGAR|nr:hypothetical protein CPB83DRAFT_609346 [Crepidotus variabilis]
MKISRPQSTFHSIAISLPHLMRFLPDLASAYCCGVSDRGANRGCVEPDVHSGPREEWYSWDSELTIAIRGNHKESFRNRA